jgi:hypothetical protein
VHAAERLGRTGNGSRSSSSGRRRLHARIALRRRAEGGNVDCEVRAVAVRRKAEVGRALKVEVEGEHLRLLGLGRHKRARTRANALDDGASGAATHGGRGLQ